MRRTTAKLVGDIVAATHHIDLSDASAKRMAAALAAYTDTVDRLAGTPLMDTEPSRFDRYVAERLSGDA